MSTLYKALQIEKEEIRLATLAPGRGEEHIQVTLSTASLLAYPKYEALSYVWGDMHKRASIIVNGTHASITKNLEAFLRRIRLPNYPRTVWADAICINQNHVGERNSQVALMKHIYKRSSRVLVSLGDEEKEARAVFDFIESLALGAHEGHVDGGCRSYQNPEWTSACDGGWSTMRRLLQQPWWSRTWVVQEITLATDAEIIWGGARLSWECFSRAVEQVLSHMEKHFDCSAKLCPDCSESFKVFTFKTSNLRLCRNALKEHHGMDLLELLVRYRASGATDPRDKIYGLLGIAHIPRTDLLPVDYSSQVEDLYLRVAISDMAATRSLRISSFAADNADSSLRIPSWVPDWASYPLDESQSVIPYRRYELYNASKSLLDKQSYVIDQMTLIVPGMKHDTVTKVSPVLETMTNTDPFGPIQECEKFVFEAHSLDSQYIAGGSFKEAFWRTVTMDMYRKAHGGVFSDFARAGPEVGRELWDMLDSFHAHDPDLQRVISDHPNNLISLNMSLPTKRCFLTDTGYLGLGHRKITPGDEVFILQGGKCPVVLRRDQGLEYMAEGKDTKPLSVYTFAGECFVHGIMDGEAARNFEENATIVHIR